MRGSWCGLRQLAPAFSRKVPGRHGHGSTGHGMGNGAFRACIAASVTIMNGNALHSVHAPQSTGLALSSAAAHAGDRHFETSPWPLRAGSACHLHNQRLHHVGRHQRNVPLMLAHGSVSAWQQGDRQLKHTSLLAPQAGAAPLPTQNQSRCALDDTHDYIQSCVAACLVHVAYTHTRKLQS